MIRPISPYKGIVDKDIEDIILYREGGRLCYFLYHYIIVEQVVRKHPLYQHSVGLFAVSKDYFAKWFLFAPNGQKLEEYFSAYLDRYTNDLRELEGMENYLLKLAASLHNVLPVNPSSLSNDELKKDFSAFCHLYRDIMIIAGNLRVIDRAVVAGLRKSFGDKGGQDELIAIAGTPSKIPFNTAEEVALLKLAADVRKGNIDPLLPEFHSRITEIVENYAWSQMGYMDEAAHTGEDYEKRVTQLLVENPEQALFKIDARLKDNAKQREDLSKDLDARGKALVRIASWAAYLKDLYKACVNKAEYFAEPLFQEIVQRTGIRKDIFLNLLPDETLALLDGVRPDMSFVNERTKQNVLVGLPGKLTLLTEGEAQEFVERYLTHRDSQKTEFKGRVASRGKVIGTAKVVLGEDDFQKLEKGEILVVSNTSPDFTPIMHKAGAIVAEEGGLTAHVSIVSREFGIPCVVGIANATEVFKDGDSVEVDANKGIVKILKRV